MIFDQLTIHNFGVYGGRHVLDLAPPSPDRPVVLIGGLNGGGKTTLLDAIQLALYGKLGNCSNRGSMAYQDFLRESIHRNSLPSEGSALEIQFRQWSAGEEHTYRVHRSWRETPGGGVRERLEVQRDGRTDEALTEIWAEQVEEFMPSGVSHLFFFDGEKIERLADPASSAQVLATAIHALLGVDLVDQLVADLTVLERRNRASLKDNAGQQEIEAVERLLRELNARCLELEQQRGGIANEIVRKRQQLKEAQHRLRLRGGDLFEQREALKRKRDETTNALEAVRADLVAVCESAAPLLLVPELLDVMAVRADHEDAAARAQALVQELEARDRTVVDQLQALGADTDLVGSLSRLLSQDRERRFSQRVEVVLGLSNEARRHLTNLIVETLPASKEHLHALLKRESGLVNDVDVLDRQLESIPAPEVIAEATKLVDQIQVELSSLEIQQRQAEAEISDAQMRRAKAEAGLRRKLEEDVGERFKQEDTQRMVAHSEKARRTLTSFRSAVVERHIERIQSLVLASFQQLLRKESLVGGIHIHPTDYAVSLTAPDGTPLPTERLSAGERQLLAVSLLWGLARASGRILPAVIDTPLGRLDSSHRMHMVERYFPYASQQVILLSTDKEIDKEYLGHLRAKIGHSYLLHYDDRTRSTSVRPGYFWKESSR